MQVSLLLAMTKIVQAWNKESETMMTITAFLAKFVARLSSSGEESFYSIAKSTLPRADNHQLALKGLEHQPIVFSIPQEKIPFPSSVEQSHIASDSDLELFVLKAKLTIVLQDYVDYSKTHCRFSLFHRHGATGRYRATAFVESFSKQTNLNEARQQLVDYLSNRKNGNTHPHSFRTMVLSKLTSPFPVKQFTTQLDPLLRKWALMAPAKKI